MSEIVGTDAQSAESSTATDLATLSPADLSSWRMTGKLPEANTSEADVTPESSTAPSGEQTASTEAKTEAPASETGQVPEVAPVVKKNAETRIQELLRERHQLSQRLAALEAQQSGKPAQAETKAASSPAPTAEPLLRTYTEQIGEKFENYEDAVQAFIKDVRAFERVEAQRANETQTREQRIAEVHSASVERFAQFREKNPKFAEQLAPEVASLAPIWDFPPGTPRGPDHDIAEAILESELGPQLAVHLSQHADVFNALIGLPSSEAVYRAIGKLEGELATKAAPVVPKTRVVSKAPAPPPVELGRNQSDPVDEEKAARENDDFAAYRRAANKREIASRRVG